MLVVMNNKNCKALCDGGIHFLRIDIDTGILKCITFSVSNIQWRTKAKAGS